MISDNIKRLRKEAGMSQVMMAKHLHVTQSAVSQWEKGGNKPDFQQLLSIADLFNVNVDDLMHGETTAGNAGLNISDTRKETKKIIEKLALLSDEQLIELRGYISGKYGK